jgi:nucleotide-binding universal stress UspA family protein
MMLPLHAILHPTDFSDRSLDAFDLACRLARDSGARLIVLHVVQPPPFVTHGEMEKALQQAKGYRRELDDKLHNLRSPAPDLTMEYRLEDGEPVTEILRAAAECDCDLIVLGTHGRTGFRRLLLGSVAEQVLRRACCPVLTVNAPVRESALRAAPPQRGVQPV